jgi:mRNA-degrading endonuclease toxin of MazEF toxin-antitoxin module
MPVPSFDRGDIVSVNLDPTSGHEQQGVRPVLVVSPREFNDLTQTVFAVPITTGGNFARVHGFTVSLDDAGTKTRGLVLCNQVRTLDLVSRGVKGPIERVPDSIIEEVRAIIGSIFDD